MLETEKIQTLASYYKATEDPNKFFRSWSVQEFKAWMVLGRHNRGYQNALEDLWIAMTEQNHRFETIVLRELTEIQKKNG